MAKPKAKAKLLNANEKPRPAFIPRRGPVFLPEVFILESLSLKDEREHRLEGRALADMLRLSGKNPKYHYFQDENELALLVKLFQVSKYRYLHLSCHGDANKIFTTHGEISDYNLARILKDSLRLKRVFFSACKVGNEAFSEIIAAQNKGMHSIVAPVQKIQFDHAASVWNALYVSLFTENEERMTHEAILKRLKALRQLFPVDFHFSTYNSNDKVNPWIHRTITQEIAPRPATAPHHPRAPAGRSGGSIPTNGSPTASQPPLAPPA